MKQRLFYILLLSSLFYSCKTAYPLGLETNESKAAFHYFANGHLTKSHYTFKVIESPKEGRVGELIKASDGLSYAGIATDLNTPIDLSQYAKISMKVMMDHIGTFSIKLEGSSTGGPNAIRTVAINKANEWEELVFDFSGSNGAGHKYHRMALFTDIHQKTTGEDVVSYFADLKLWGKGTASAFDLELKEGFRLVVLGSSTAAGTGASIPDSSWVNRYSRYLATVEEKSQVINIALGGYTTYHLLPTEAIIPKGRIQPDTLRNATAALKYKPDAVVINLPSNDTSKDYPVEEQLHNFNILSDFFDEKGIPVWVCTTQPRNYDDRKRAIQLLMKDSLLARYGDKCLDVWTPFATDQSIIDPSFDSGDGVHLNDTGHRTFMDIVVAENIPQQAKRMAGRYLNLMTYNMRLDLASDGDNAWVHRKEAFVQQIRTYKPDIIGTQEGMPHQIEFIDQNLDNFSFVGSGRDGGTNGEYCALFYKEDRFEILASGTFWLSETPSQPSKGWDAAYRRICTYALFKNRQTDEIFWVFNTHLDNEGVKARRKGLKLLNQKVKELNKGQYPVILMGDLNAEPNDKIILQQSRKFIDAHSVVGNDPIEVAKGTFNAFDSSKAANRRIDYIFLSKKDFFIENYVVPITVENGHYPSDHFPVVIEVRNVQNN